jgi:hypothetical protein
MIFGHSIDGVKSDIKMPDIDEDLIEKPAMCAAIPSLSDDFVPQDTEFVSQFGKGI